MYSRSVTGSSVISRYTPTSNAHKGTGADWISRIFETADPHWAHDCIHSGMSSGEGMLTDEVLRVLRSAGSSGISRIDLYQIFIGHRSKDKISAALIRLLAAGKVRREQRPGSRGLAGEMWFAV